MKIFKVAYCNWCGNENLQIKDNDTIYCFNCNEETKIEKLKYRKSWSTEEVSNKTK